MVLHAENVGKNPQMAPEYRRDEWALERCSRELSKVEEESLTP
jgi:hypothetical protein